MSTPASPSMPRSMAVSEDPNAEDVPNNVTNKTTNSSSDFKYVLI